MRDGVQECLRDGVLDSHAHVHAVVQAVTRAVTERPVLVRFGCDEVVGELFVRGRAQLQEGNSGGGLVAAGVHRGVKAKAVAVLGSFGGSRDTSLKLKVVLEGGALVGEPRVGLRSDAAACEAFEAAALFAALVVWTSWQVVSHLNSKSPPSVVVVEVSRKESILL